jgi:hypothetical protein
VEEREGEAPMRSIRVFGRTFTFCDACYTMLGTLFGNLPKIRAALSEAGIHVGIPKPRSM